MAIKEVGPLQTGSSAVATGRVEATCTVAGGLEAPRNLAERARQVASGAHEVASSPRERLRAAETQKKNKRGPHVAAFTDNDTLAQLHSYELPSS